MLGAGAGGDLVLRQSFLFCSFLFHSRRRRGPSLALISALLGHRLPAAAVARPAPLQRAASLTFCYFLASLLRLPAARLIPPPPSPPPPPAGSPPSPPPRLPRAAAFGDVLRPRLRGTGVDRPATRLAAACALEPEKGQVWGPGQVRRAGARAGGAQPLRCFY